MNVCPTLVNVIYWLGFKPNWGEISVGIKHGDNLVKPGLIVKYKLVKLKTIEFVVIKRSVSV